MSLSYLCFIPAVLDGGHCICVCAQQQYICGAVQNKKMNGNVKHDHPSRRRVINATNMPGACPSVCGGYTEDTQRGIERDREIESLLHSTRTNEMGEYYGNTRMNMNDYNE